MTGWSERMLEPDGRAALTEQLRPPAGYELIYAVGTTFTLDLTTALSIPLSFAGHQLREDANQIAILDAVRRATEKVDIFAQAGQIRVPPASDLVAFLEPMVHPVVPRRAGALFHPKVWVLEFGRGSSRSYRFLCSSRNLTGDHSWDVMVRLDGEPTATKQVRSAPIRDFLMALPPMAVVPLPSVRAGRIRELALRVGEVEWELPPDVREVEFHPFGVGRPDTIDLKGKRHLIVSPFLSNEGIDLAAPFSKESITVVSRKESFDALSPATLTRITGFVLNDAAIGADESPDEALVGLHAKIFALDRMSGSRVFAGSANATDAAFSGNVEFMVELVGPQPRMGVAAIFGPESDLLQMMEPYNATGGVLPSNTELADFALESALRSVASAQLRNTVVPEGTELYSIYIETISAARLKPEFSAVVTLLSRPGNAVPLPSPAAGEWVRTLPLTDVTPFLVVRVTDARGESLSTVVRAELVGDIPNRRDAIIAARLDTPEKFLQLLLLMLSLTGADASRLPVDSAGGFGEWAMAGGGVFESLVKALEGNPGALDDLAPLISRLRDDPRNVLPPDFPELWDSIWAARLRIKAVVHE